MSLAQPLTINYIRKHHSPENNVLNVLIKGQPHQIRLTNTNLYREDTQPLAKWLPIPITREEEIKDALWDENYNDFNNKHFIHGEMDDFDYETGFAFSFNEATLDYDGSQISVFPRTLVITCIDHRFVPHICEKVSGLVGEGNFDLLTAPGAMLYMSVNNEDTISQGTAIIKSIKTSIAVNNVQQILVIDHEDCGAYKAVLGRDDTFNDHQKHMNISTAILRNVLKDDGVEGISLIEMRYLQSDGDLIYVSKNDDPLAVK